MVIYRGVVKDGVVVLPDDADLPDGQQVEVRIVPVSPEGTWDDERERRFVLHLREAGYLSSPEGPAPDQAEDDFAPIEVSGIPLSQMIIEERR